MTPSTDLVRKVFNNLFGAAPDLMDQMLTYEGKEQERVQLAILKLSDGHPDKLRHNVKAAKIDYRDVLAWAEYPEQMETGATRFNSEPEVIEALEKRDRDQYQTWLDEQGVD